MPAWGRPIWAAVPVPWLTTPSSIAVTVAATWALITLLHLGLPLNTRLPVAVATLVMAMGSHRIPPFAITE